LAGTPAAGAAEPACHKDLAPRILVLRDQTPLAFIDFDGVEPGRRCDDIAYLLWTFLDLGSPDAPTISVTEQGRAMRHFCDAYAQSGTGPAGIALHRQVPAALLRQQARILRFRCDQARTDADPQVREFASTRAGAIADAIVWTRRERARLLALLTDDHTEQAGRYWS
jgi:aminoglycoside phosphotransferase (APT) family kinase protein